MASKYAKHRALSTYVRTVLNTVDAHTMIPQSVVEKSFAAAGIWTDGHGSKQIIRVGSFDPELFAKMRCTKRHTSENAKQTAVPVPRAKRAVGAKKTTKQKKLFFDTI